MIHMKLVGPSGYDHQKMFECLEDKCDSVVPVGRINTHAQRVHDTTEVVVDASLGFQTRERKNPMCEECGHSMWYHNYYGLCSRCDLHG